MYIRMGQDGNRSVDVKKDRARECQPNAPAKLKTLVQCHGEE